MNTVKLLRGVEYLIHKGYQINMSVSGSSNRYQTGVVYSLTFFNGKRSHILFTILDHSLEDLVAIIYRLVDWEISRSKFELEPDELETVVCSACAGSGMGYTPNSSCRRCGGSGELPEEES